MRIAPNADDSAWISFDDGDRLTVLALLDADGVPAPGWPIEIPFAEDCVPYAMSDGSVRLACAYSEADEDCADACGDDRVFAWDAAARPLAVWPVRFEPGLPITIDRHGARVFGTDLVLSRFEGDDEFEDEVGLMGMAQLLRLAADGTVRPGTGVRTSQWCCAIGPDGRGYARNVVHAEDGAQTTTLTAFDESGPVAGWPIELPGDVSLPSFGPNGLLYMTSWSATEESSLLVRGADGRDVPGVADRRIEGSVTWDPRWFAPLAPEVDDAGRAYVLFDDRALAFDATLAPLPGWPYRPSTGFVVAGECPPGDTGCQPYTVPPTVNGAGVLYLLETSGGSGAGRITAVNRDGTVRSGWPVTLRRPGAEFQSVTLAPSGIAFAVALEPEPGEGHSVTILAIARNSTVLWTRTIGEP